MKLKVVTAVTALALSSTFGHAQRAGVQAAAEREIRRQEAMTEYAQQAVNKGTEAMMEPGL